MKGSIPVCGVTVNTIQIVLDPVHRPFDSRVAEETFSNDRILIRVPY